MSAPTTDFAMEHIAAGEEVEPWAIPVRFGGMELWLTRGGSLAPKAHFQDGASFAPAGLASALGFGDSYAHLLPSGEIKRYGKVIGRSGDLVAGWRSR